MPSTKEVLISAKKLIANPDRWIRGSSAQDRDGNEVPVQNGVSFCSLGAVDRIVFDPSNKELNYYEVEEALNAASPDGDAIKTNDQRSHEEVMAMFDRAIADAE